MTMTEPTAPSMSAPLSGGPVSSTASSTADSLWYKDAVIYQLHVKSFFDANDDGIGDFEGLIAKLDYIKDLGVNTIWLLPFYPSPRKDDGYDIAAYEGVHADYGTLDDARRFIAEAHARGLRVITELVVNHTSDQHPWFQRARIAPPGSPDREFYVWSDTNDKYTGTRIIFIDTEKSNWAWDPIANAYYWHRFYSHQPDLNYDNPAVLEAVLGVMRYWLEAGVDGLRLDAVPYLVEREGTNNENLPETHAILKLIRAELERSYPGRLLLAEANQWPEDTQHYFGDGDECQMAFHFPLMPRMYMALAQEDRFPITDILRQTPAIPDSCQWAIFLRNHDELTLEMVTDKERDYLWETYAADRRARLNLGIRRRLAPLVQRDRKRIELLNSLLLSMPGTPVIYYGDELGMGDNIHLGDRDGVRTPMQWSVDRNGGFSRADPASMVLPPIMDPLYGYQAVNVEAQSRDAYSLLNWMRRMLAVRGQQRVFGRGALRLLSPQNRRILAYLRELPSGEGDERVLCVANMSRTAQAVELDLSQFAGQVPVEMIGGTAFPPIGRGPYQLTLPPHGFFWFLLAGESQMPSWFQAPPEPLPDLLTFVVRSNLAELLTEPSRSLLEDTVLPAWLPKRRWYAGKDETLLSTKIMHSTSLPGLPESMQLMEVEVKTTHTTQRYFVPMGYLSEDAVTSALPHQLALGRMRQGRNVGLLTGGFSVDGFAHHILASLRASEVLPDGAGGELRFVPTSKLAELTIAPDAEIRRLSGEQSNSSLVMGNGAILKLIRRIEGGQHPEAEMGRYLTEGGFEHLAPLLGEVTRIDASGTPYVLAVLQGFLHNQGDAWTWTINILQRAIQDLLGVQAAPGSSRSSSFDEMAQFASVLGKRIGEMHVVLAKPSDDPDFKPELFTAEQRAGLETRVNARLDAARAVIESHGPWSHQETAVAANVVLGARDALRSAVQRLAESGVGSPLTRTHGDLHLGQILVAQGDAYVIDFEGEPSRPLAERREKTSPLRDVAGVLRSFAYAAAVGSHTGGPAPSAELEQARSHLATRFRQLAEDSFLAAYAEATADTACAIAERARRDLVDLFLLEKAAYEISYEAESRPAWIGVPLQGLAELATRLGEVAR